MGCGSSVPLSTIEGVSTPVRAPSNVSTFSDANANNAGLSTPASRGSIDSRGMAGTPMAYTPTGEHMTSVKSNDCTEGVFITKVRPLNLAEWPFPNILDIDSKDTLLLTVTPNMTGGLSLLRMNVLESANQSDGKESHSPCTSTTTNNSENADRFESTEDESDKADDKKSTEESAEEKKAEEKEVAVDNEDKEEEIVELDEEAVKEMKSWEKLQKDIATSFDPLNPTDKWKKALIHHFPYRSISCWRTNRYGILTFRATSTSSNTGADTGGATDLTDFELEAPAEAVRDVLAQLWANVQAVLNRSRDFSQKEFDAAFATFASKGEFGTAPADICANFDMDRTLSLPQAMKIVEAMGNEFDRLEAVCLVRARLAKVEDFEKVLDLCSKGDPSKGFEPIAKENVYYRLGIRRQQAESLHRLARLPMHLNQKQKSSLMRVRSTNSDSQIRVNGDKVKKLGRYGTESMIRPLV